ncbi:MAG: hypothetical protein EAS51_13680 [Microbacteriaceae bacterium]|nr:MAG: hypothetical protein EAS51_13680 [Microbacteriaceae bacterium]
MTVAAPSTLAAFGSAVERARRGIACAACGASASASDLFCSRCGSRVVVAREGRRPADVAATRSLQLGLAVVVANAVIGTLTLGVVVLVSDAARLMEAALFLEAIKLLVVAALATASIRFGVRGLRETADGMLRRRGWAVAGLVISSCFAVLVVLSFVLTLVLALA